ncbi:MAG: GIY-YIG nuclease family protein [bacterium]|nr:GIY-YIG nuclease family protein [bacterium]
MYYVYLLQSIPIGKLYMGYTKDLRARLNEHNQRKSIATKAAVPFELVYYEAYRSKKDALRRERQLKRYKQGYTRLKERLTFSLAGQN